MTRKEIVAAFKQEAQVRINSVIRSAYYLQSKKKITTPEARAFLMGLEHARTILETMGVHGTVRYDGRLAREVESAKKGLGGKIECQESWNW